MKWWAEPTLLNPLYVSLFTLCRVGIAHQNLVEGSPCQITEDQNPKVVRFFSQLSPIGDDLYLEILNAYSIYVTQL